MPRLWTIRQYTFDQLARGSRERYLRAVVGELAEQHASAAYELGAREFRRSIDRGVAAALALEIDTESDVADFLDLWMQAQEMIEGKWPWAGKILRSLELSGSQRLSMIRQMMC